MPLQGGKPRLRPGPLSILWRPCVRAGAGSAGGLPQALPARGLLGTDSRDLRPHVHPSFLESAEDHGSPPRDRWPRPVALPLRLTISLVTCPLGGHSPWR